MDAARSLNSVQAVKAETAQTRQLFRICECTHTHRTGYFIVKIVQQGLYIHGKGRKQGYFSLKNFGLFVDDQCNGFAKRNNESCLVTQTKLSIINQSNRVF